MPSVKAVNSAYCAKSYRTLRVLMNLPSQGHCPQGTATEPASSRDSLPSPPPLPKVPLAYLTSSVHETSLFLQFSMIFLVWFFFPSSPKGTRAGISIVAFTSALSAVTLVSLWPRPLRKLTSVVEGKGEEILVAMGWTGSLLCRLLSTERESTVTSYTEKLIEFSCTGG